MWSRKSIDNGVTWLPDDFLSDVISPLPAQADPGIVSTYVGDYDYGSATATKHITSWVDGRVTISGQSQPDAFFDSEPATASPTPTSTPSASPTATPRPTPTPQAASDSAASPLDRRRAKNGAQEIVISDLL